MPKKMPNASGQCPYCVTTNFVSEESRHETQIKMKCGSCNQWSIRSLRNGYQYPLYDPTDKDSSPYA